MRFKKETIPVQFPQKIVYKQVINVEISVDEYFELQDKDPELFGDIKAALLKSIRPEKDKED